MAEKKKEIRRMEIEPAENGGHTVTHHYKETPTHSGKDGVGMSYTPSEHHVFGKNEGHHMLAHIANHLAIPETMPDEDDNDSDDDSDGDE